MANPKKSETLKVTCESVLPYFGYLKANWKGGSGLVTDVETAGVLGGFAGMLVLVGRTLHVQFKGQVTVNGEKYDKYTLQGIS